MKIQAAFLAAMFLFGATEASAQECSVTAGGNPAVVFLDGGATATQSGSLGMQCTADVSPVVTVSGDGPGAGYDFSGTMTSGSDQIPFTGTWDSTPPVSGGTPTLWTFTATATNLLTAPPGHYETRLTFTINP